MNKQEEIRELIDTILTVAPVPLGDVVNVRNTILEALGAKGVVIKVDRELPEIEFFDCADASKTKTMTLASNHTIDLMLKAGYVAVEPLVEE